MDDYREGWEGKRMSTEGSWKRLRDEFWIKKKGNRRRKQQQKKEDKGKVYEEDQRNNNGVADQN